MKKFFQIFLIAVSVISIISCNREYPDITSEKGFNGLFVRNYEGTVTYYSEIDSSVTSDVYSDVNGTSIGNDLLALTLYDVRGYLLQGEGSGQEIEMINSKTFVSLGKIGGFNNLTDLVCVSDQFVYASETTTDESMSGSVLIMDSLTLDINTTLKVGKNPTQLAYTRGKRAYVANTGTEAYPDSTIMVIDVTEKSVIDTVALEQELDNGSIAKLQRPVEMVIDGYQNIWVLCEGIDNVGAGIAKVNFVSHEVKVFPFTNEYVGPGKNGMVRGRLGTTILYVNDGTYSMSIDDEELPTTKFFKGEFADKVFDAIGANTFTTNFYCSEDGENGENGVTYVFDRHGYNTNDAMFEVGEKPRQIIFVRD
ncbi:YncE family protein [Labilibacter marinus]|uniref:YncE family protein n=1 Tax=Labilibacter marinus TaxID=1477105 RepID=UPI000829D9C5|nr:hypothetical protein [Labilibacter marinus]